MSNLDSSTENKPRNSTRLREIRSLCNYLEFPNSKVKQNSKESSTSPLSLKSLKDQLITHSNTQPEITFTSSSNSRPCLLWKTRLIQPPTLRMSLIRNRHHFNKPVPTLDLRHILKQPAGSLSGLEGIAVQTLHRGLSTINQKEPKYLPESNSSCTTNSPSSSYLKNIMSSATNSFSVISSSVGTKKIPLVSQVRKMLRLPWPKSCSGVPDIQYMEPAPSAPRSYIKTEKTFSRTFNNVKLSSISPLESPQPLDEFEQYQLKICTEPVVISMGSDHMKEAVYTHKESSLSNYEFNSKNYAPSSNESYIDVEPPDSPIIKVGSDLSLLPLNSLYLPSTPSSIDSNGSVLDVCDSDQVESCQLSIIPLKSLHLMDSCLEEVSTDGMTTSLSGYTSFEVPQQDSGNLLNLTIDKLDSLSMSEKPQENARALSPETSMDPRNLETNSCELTTEEDATMSHGFFNDDCPIDMESSYKFYEDLGGIAPPAHILQIDVDDTLIPTSQLCDQNALDKSLHQMPPEYQEKLQLLDEKLITLFKQLELLLFDSPDLQKKNKKDHSTSEVSTKSSKKATSKLARMRSSDISGSISRLPSLNSLEKLQITNNASSSFFERMYGQSPDRLSIVKTKSFMTRPYTNMTNKDSEKATKNFLFLVVIVTNATMSHIHLVFDKFFPKFCSFLQEQQMQLDDLVCSARDLWSSEFPLQYFYEYWKCWTLKDIVSHLSQQHNQKFTIVSIGDDEPERRAAAYVKQEMRDTVKALKLIKMIFKPNVDQILAQLEHLTTNMKQYIEFAESFDIQLDLNSSIIKPLSMFPASHRSFRQISVYESKQSLALIVPNPFRAFFLQFQMKLDQFHDSFISCESIYETLLRQPQDDEFLKKECFFLNNTELCEKLYRHLIPLFDDRRRDFDILANDCAIFLKQAYQTFDISEFFDSRGVAFLNTFSKDALASVDHYFCISNEHNFDHRAVPDFFNLMHFIIRFLMHHPNTLIDNFSQLCQVTLIAVAQAILDSSQQIADRGTHKQTFGQHNLQCLPSYTS